LSTDPRIPQLKADVRFSTFDEASASRGRRLVEVGETCFAVSEEMYHLLAALLDRPSTMEVLTADLNRRLGRELTVDAVGQLLEQRIPPALRADQPQAVRKTPFLVRARLFSARAVQPLTSRLTWLFDPRMAAAVLATFAVVIALCIRDAAAAIHGSLTTMELVLLYCGIALTGLIHELGHATASHRYGCEHGDIGFGLYYIFPAFYADVTKAWRLPPRQRAVIDAGGLYFNALALIPLTTYAILTGNHVALRLVWITLFIMLQNLNPFFKFDGYWLFSDLSGLTNLHARMTDAVSRFGRRLLGRPNAADPNVIGLRRGLLYLYVAVVAAYSVFVVDFLVRSVRLVFATYPTRAAQTVSALVGGLHVSAWGDVALQSWRVVTISLWPLVLIAALASVAARFIGRARKFVGEL